MVISHATKSVEARLEPVETSLAKNRELARHFSHGLYLDNIPGLTEAVIYFRLFELSADDFLLYQSPIHELGIHHGKTPGADIAKRLLTEAGGFIGNGPSADVARGPYRLGPPRFKGGDGTAERRYLEVSELVTRQAIRHARWFFDHMPAELFIGYLPFPDEQEHNWLGLAAGDTRYNEYRRWTYAMVNRFAAVCAGFARPGDHLLFVSDHGMAPVTHRVAIHTALRDAGLLEATPGGGIVKERTKAVHLRNCIVLNTTDWKGGIVPLSDRAGLIAQVRQALAAIRHDGKAVITRFYDSSADAARFGFGADLCFDYLPGYDGSDGVTTPVVTTLSAPSGVHGFDPSRDDMQAILIASGPRFGKTREGRARAIDIVPLVCELLGIPVPAGVEGRVPVTLR